MIEELKALLKIDKYLLDEELVKQPALFFRIADAHTEALAMRDTKKEELTTVDAELDGKIRADHDKITEANIRCLIQVAPKHVEAFIAYNEAKVMADRLGALKEAFVQRNYMLRDLVQLTTTGLYELSSVRETPTTQAVVYEGRRRQLAERRKST